MEKISDSLSKNPPFARSFVRVVHGRGIHLHLVEVEVVVVDHEPIVVIFVLAFEVRIPE